MPVEYSPVFVFLGGVNLSFSNKTSPNCLGEPMLNSMPQILKIDFSRTLIFFSNSDESDCKYLVFILIPFISISKIELTSDFSR